MLYASSRLTVMTIASAEAEIEVTKKLEAGTPEEITESVIVEEMEPESKSKGTAEGAAKGRGFERPKRPGRR